MKIFLPHCPEEMRERVVYCAVVVLLALLYAVMYVIYPFYNDDVWYTCESVGMPGSLEYLQSTVKTCFEHWQWDTARLANMACAPFLGFFPKWVYGLLTGGLIWAIYMLGPAIVGVRWLSLSTALWVLVVTFVFPWMEFMFGVVYSINYIWTIALALILIWSLLRSKENSNIVVLFFLSFVVGWWHEGMSMPLVASLVVYCLVKGRIPSRKLIFVMAGLVVGLLVLMALPAFGNQLGSRESNLFKSVWWETVVNAIAFNCMFYAFTIAMIVALIKRRVRSRLFSQGRRGLAVCAGVFAFGAISTIIYFKYYNGARTGAFNQIVCSLGLLYILRELFVDRGQIWWRRLSVCAMAIVLSASIFNLIESVRIQFKLTREFNDVQMLLSRNSMDDGCVVFYDQTPIKFGVDFLKPSYMALNTKYGLGEIMLLPSVLSDFDARNAEIRRLEDNLFLYRNKILMRGPAGDTRRDVIVVNQQGISSRSRTRFREFRDRSGEIWTYVSLHAQTMNSDFQIADAHLAD